MPANVYFDQLAQRLEEEGLFARDEAGQLIRYVEKTQQDYDRFVTVTIDGVPIRVRKASPTKNAQGDVIYEDAAGRTIPRDTTINDAVMQLLDQQNAQRRASGQAPQPSPVPTLCHLEHLHPVGVCRVCAVAVGKFERDRTDPDIKNLRFQPKLVPACVHPVEDGMYVVTLGFAPAQLPVAHAGTSKSDAVREAKEKERIEKETKLACGEREKIASNVRVLLELLAGDHLATMPPVAAPAAQLTDLERLVARYGEQLGIDPNRFPSNPQPPRPIDDSSPLIHVDHSACILCDRCTRCCTDVKQNFVIARAGKGYNSSISFDLGVPMGDSSCVQCGECMLSCPTSALTFRSPIESDWYQAQIKAGKQAVTPAEMEDSKLLRVLPWRYREWNQSAVVRWRLKPGDELCVQGEYGATAYILNSGTFNIWLKDPRSGVSGAAGTFSGPLPDLGQPDFVRSHEDEILGEMACMNQYPRGATVRAATESEVFEIRRNVLFTLQRNPAARAILDRVYRQRALGDHLRSVPLFKDLTAGDRAKCREILDQALAPPAPNSSAGRPTSSEDSLKTTRRLVDLVRVEPGQLIFRQGERADCFYMIRFGFVKVSETYGDEERVTDYLGQNKSFGEIACLSDIPAVRDALPPEFQVAYQGRRTASCAALDDVEMVRIDLVTFRELVDSVPALKDKLIAQAQAALSRFQHAAKPTDRPRTSTAAMRSFTDQGLYNAQRLLVLDLDACTRCDECTKACSDTHHGITRLIRDGLRFDKWLVAGSCRSCSDPYCLVGCPVDAIHRDGNNLEIVIERHCIGCGLCASNCPYGNINMHGAVEANEVTGKAELRYRATTCDLCSQIVGNDYTQVSCVHACPHEAAYRMTGDMLLQTIQASPRRQ